MIRGRRVLWVAAVVAGGCGGSQSLSGFGNDSGVGDDGGADASQTFGTGSGSSSGMLGGPTTDFSSSPVIDGSAPPNSASMFGAPTQGGATGGPCLVEPENNVLYPQNWLRPRFRWVAPGGQTLFELRVHIPNQTNDLVVYTTNTSWTMPRMMWDGVRMHSAGRPITISVRGGVQSGNALQGEALGSQTSAEIAPVSEGGAIVYWTTNDATTGGSVLKGFSPGDETVGPVLTAAQYLQGQQPQASSMCIGCHASTPDGEFAGFTYQPNGGSQWKAGIALIDQDAGAVGSAPSFMNAAGTTAMGQYNLGGATFSPAHWGPGDRTVIFSFDDMNGNNSAGAVTSAQLAWINLDAKTFATTQGTLARSGDTQLAGAPSWSHDGNTVAYVSTNRVCTGRLGNCINPTDYNKPPDPGSRADIYTVPYGGGIGGQTTPLAGASDPNFQEYYPAYTPDDQLIGFNRIANDLNLYHQPAAELFIVAASGGTAKRLDANDPPACSGMTSPGISNAWPKWGPAALKDASGNTYYFMIFSSRRTLPLPPPAPQQPTDQLYITAVVKKTDGTLETHGAIYLWNQPPSENNHTPAWDKFKVPPLPTVQ
jgi:hypothetical protein